MAKLCAAHKKKCEQLEERNYASLELKNARLKKGRTPIVQEKKFKEHDVQRRVL